MVPQANRGGDILEGSLSHSPSLAVIEAVASGVAHRVDIPSAQANKPPSILAG